MGSFFGGFAIAAVVSLIVADLVLVNPSGASMVDSAMALARAVLS